MRNLVVVREDWGQVKWNEADGSGQENEVLGLATDQDSGDTYHATKDGRVYRRSANGKVKLLVVLHKCLKVDVIFVGQCDISFQLLVAMLLFH